MSVAVLVVASLCAINPAHQLHLSPVYQTTYFESARIGLGLLPLPVFGSFAPTEYIYLTDHKKPYRVRVGLPAFILNSQAYRPERDIAACTAVG